jgi:acetyl-CoA carboxylase biotin carboxylase subunit
MHRALLELTLDGVETSRDFHLRLMEDAEFRAGDFDIQWLERRLDSLIAVSPPPEGVRAAALAAAFLAEEDRLGRMPAMLPVASGDQWQRAARLDALRE